MRGFGRSKDRPRKHRLRKQPVVSHYRSLFQSGSKAIQSLTARRSTPVLCRCGTEHLNASVMIAARLPILLVGEMLVAAIVFAFIADLAKAPVFKRLGIA
jgi:hypothetical protein